MKRPAFTDKQRLDTFKAFGAIVCCQAKGCDSAIAISEAEIDHHVALIDGGKHELGNFRPICSSCHRKKSAREHKANSKAKRLATKSSGTWRKKSRPIKSRGFAQGHRPMAKRQDPWSKEWRRV